MKNCLRPARRAVDRDCDTEMCAASAKEKAIACLSTDVRPRCNSKVRSDGNARAQRSALGIPAECLAGSRFPPSQLTGAVMLGVFVALIILILYRGVWL
jgi:hypothetical protein